MKIFDCFTFCDEIDVLKMRLDLHYEHVDRFYICEANRTFRGALKPYNFEDNRYAFKKWQEKITYIKHVSNIDDLDLSHRDASFNFQSPYWRLEHDQRNALSFCLSDAEGDDIAIVSDVDEFLSPAFFQMLKDSAHARSFDIARLGLRNHYYFMNCAAIGENREWRLPLAVKAAKWEETGNISEARSCLNIGLSFENCGWHFSYLGGPEAIQKKISSFSHSEVDIHEINNEDNITKSIENGVDYIGRPGHEFAFYPISSYPKEIQTLMKKNPWFVKWAL